MSTTAVQSFDSGHTDVVHDAQFDYYGKRLATCSSDGVVKVFDVTGNQQKLLADLVGHRGPVWQVSWAHPKFGSLLATCSFDNTVIVWKETAANLWSLAYQSLPTLHSASVNSVCWGPHETGAPVLACGSSDGTISVIEYDQDNAQGPWKASKFPEDGTPAHAIGVTAVSWAPATPPGALVSSGRPAALVKRLVSAGCDNTAKVWAEDGGRWKMTSELTAHTDWVRDVAWGPSIGLPKSTIVSAGQDGRAQVGGQQQKRQSRNGDGFPKTPLQHVEGGRGGDAFFRDLPAVIAWTLCGNLEGPWQPNVVCKLDCPAWRVSWSLTGNMVAVSDASDKVQLWNEVVDGTWQQVCAA